MEKIKVIDLLNRVHNGDIPAKIKYRNKIYEFSKIQDDYIPIDDEIEGILDDLLTFKMLNDEVEIIEEDKKIEKIEPTNYCIDTLREKINEIIDYLEEE